jgi:hypothetical protein
VKAYLITTGLLFGLLASLHLWLTISHWSKLTADPWFVLQGPGLGAVGAALSFWAWRLLWTSGRS